MSKVIDATLKLNDQFTGKLGKAITAMDKAATRGGKLGAAIQKAGDSISKVGTGLTKTFTLPIMAVGGASYAAWKEVDAGMDGIAKVTGATGEALDALQESAKNVFKSMPTDMTNVSTAIGDINTRFGLTGDALEDASKQFIKFADVNDTDMSAAIANVSRYMGDAGIDASELGSVLDQLTIASQTSGITVDALSEQCTKFGAPMRALGLTTQESIAMFSSWEKAGVNTDIAFSGMKKAISNWGKEGKDSSEEFKKTLDLIKSCPDIASATSKAIEVFGSKAGPDLADAIQGGRFEYEDFLKVVEGSKGQLSATYDETLDPVDKFTTAMNNLKIAGSGVFDVLQEKLAPVIEKISGKVSQFTDWIGGLNDAQIETGLKIAGVVAAIGPALVIIGKVVSAIGAVVKIGGMISGAFSAISGAVAGAGGAMAVLTGPIGWAIAGIAALIAIGVALFKNWDKIKPYAQKAFGAIKPLIDGVRNVFSGFVNFFKKLWGQIPNILNKTGAPITSIGSKFGAVANKVIPLITKIVNTIKVLWNAFKESGALTRLQVIFTAVFGGIVGFVQSAINSIMDVIGHLMDFFGGVCDFMTGVFTGNWSLAFDGIKTMISSWGQIIVGLVKAPVNAIIGIINGAISAINGMGFTIPDWVPVVGGKAFQLNVPTIPQLYKGTNNFAGGMTSINERGGEIIDLPHGSRVYPHDESVQMARREAGANITIAKLADSIIVREDADIDRIATALVQKLNKTRVAMGGAY